MVHFYMYKQSTSEREREHNGREYGEIDSIVNETADNIQVLKEREAVRKHQLNMLSNKYEVLKNEMELVQIEKMKQQ